MSTKRRIPARDDDFNNFINITADYLLDTAPGTAVPNWERLGFSTNEKNQYIGHRNSWNTAYDVVLVNNEAGVRDSVAIRLKNNAKKDFIEFVLDPEANLLNRVGASPNVNDNDRAMFNIKVRDDIPTPRPPIETKPYPQMLPLGGGKLRFELRVQHDSTRASMHPDADSIEVAYFIGTEPPASLNEDFHHEVYKGAIHVFDAGINNTAKRLFAFFRWKNETDDSKSGPWCDMVQVVIA